MSTAILQAIANAAGQTAQSIAESAVVRRAGALFRYHPAEYARGGDR
jgi:hypothetical protein